MKYEGPNSNQSKDMANVKVFADIEMDKRTGQKLYALDLSMQGHKKLEIKFVKHMGSKS